MGRLGLTGGPQELGGTWDPDALARRAGLALVAGAAIALTSNLINLTDLRPGRALKAYLVLAAFGVLSVGAFGTLYKQTKEPLLKELLRMIIQDEARHVHYGVCALREHFTKHITERERQEREDWSFEVALLMRNRFAAYEVFEEWFEGRMTRAEWRNVVYRSKGMNEFRTVMFSRLVPNLREIGLLSPRIMPRYEEVGLMQYFGGAAADKLTAEKLLADLH